MSKILVVEDDQQLSDRICDWLTSQNYTVERVTDGKEAWQLLQYYHFDVVVLDWNLPGLSGIDICREYRKIGGKAPLLMLTGNSAVQDKMSGLDSGADDYLTKPFSFDELAARIRALSRRLPNYEEAALKLGELVIDRTKHSVTYRGQQVCLNPKEFEILELLARYKDTVFSQEAILDRIWPSGSEATSASVRTTIKTLRKKLDKVENIRILTVHGYGYRLKSSQ